MKLLHHGLEGEHTTSEVLGLVAERLQEADLKFWVQLRSSLLLRLEVHRIGFPIEPRYESFCA